MDVHYDFDKAANFLKDWAKDRQNSNTWELSNFSKLGGITITPVTHPHCWKVTASTSDSDEIEEVVFTIQGAITQKDLPPIISNVPRKPRFLRQSIQLTGFNTPIFQSYINNLCQIHELFSRQFPEHTLDEFQPDNFITYSSLNFGTRYFTSRRDDPHSVQVSFSPTVDPKGILSSMQNNIYVHAGDNTVLYYMLLNETPPQFKPTAPTHFRIGDIVEVQTTIIAVPIKQGHFKMIHQLRSIALINSSFSQEASGHRLKSSIRPSILDVSLKRRIGYENDGDEDDVTHARKSINDMQIQ